MQIETNIRIKNKLLFTACLVLFSWGISSCHVSVSQNPDHPAYFSRLIDSASILVDRGYAERAVQFIDSAYAAFPKAGPGDNWKKYFFKLNLCNRDTRKEYDKALLYADSMLFIIQGNGLENSHKLEYTRSNYAKGDVLFKMGRYNEAYRYFYKGKLFVETHLDPCDRAGFISRFAMVNFQRGQFMEAALRFKESIKASAPCHVASIEFVVYLQEQMDNTGLSYYKAGLKDSAMKYYNMALEYIDKYQPLFPGKGAFFQDAKAVIYGNIGVVYYDRGDIADAESLIRKSILTNSREGAEQVYAQDKQSQLVKLYLETARLPEAKAALQELRASLDTLPNRKTELNWQKLAWNYYTATKATNKAEQHLQNYLSLKDAAEAEDRKLEHINPFQEFQNLDQQYQLTLLKRENEMKYLYLLVAAVFLIMLALIIFLGWRNWNRSRKNNKTLTRLNRQISDQNLNLQTTLSSLEQTLEDNARLMKVVVHDLRNPIGAIGSISSLMLGKGDCSSEQAKLLKMIGESSSNSLNLINEMLEANAAPEEMKMEPVEMEGLLQYCVDLLQYKAAEKKQRIVLQAEPMTLVSNRGKMWRAISNLVGNAIKFSPEGSAITIRMTKNKDSVCISVEDKGIGIPDQLKEKIFEFHTDAKRTGTSGERPFGMGLSISKKIIEAHGGRIWFEGNTDRGTTFYIECPLFRNKLVA